mmetsp:Transcript_18102/g.37257  ORF Transcript_18102/g.37257 Transcript_18102/m.37257 type:complete len:118 (-) Transcript_18102:1042-1395(-)
MPDRHNNNNNNINSTRTNQGINTATATTTYCILHTIYALPLHHETPGRGSLRGRRFRPSQATRVVRPPLPLCRIRGVVSARQGRPAAVSEPGVGPTLVGDGSGAKQEQQQQYHHNQK